LMTITGIGTGILLRDLAIVIPSAIADLVILLYIGGIVFYPFLKRRFFLNQRLKKII